MKKLLLLVIMLFLFPIDGHALIRDEGNIPATWGYSLDSLPGVLLSLNFPAGKNHSISIYGGNEGINNYAYSLFGVGFYTHTGKVLNNWFYQGPIVGTLYDVQIISRFNSTTTLANYYLYLAYMYGWRAEGYFGNISFSAGPYYTKNQFGAIARITLEMDWDIFSRKNEAESR